MKRPGNVFAVVGLLALCYWAYETMLPRLYQSREMPRFAGKRQAEPERATQSASSRNAERPMPANGSAIAMLEIPRLGLSTVVVEGAEDAELKLGAGRIRGTALPGDGGNVGVAGHRDTFFRPLRLIRTGDTIRLVTHELQYHYKVVSTRIVEPGDIYVLYPTGSETLTLVTCYPFDFVGPAPRRFIVRADCEDCIGPAR